MLTEMDEGYDDGWKPPERKNWSWLYGAVAIGALVLLVLLYISPAICMMGFVAVPLILLEELGNDQGEWWVADKMSSTVPNGTWTVSSDNEDVRLRIVMVPENASANATWGCAVRAYDVWTGVMVANETFNSTTSALIDLPGSDGFQARSYLIEYEFTGVRSFALVFEEKLDYFMTD